MALRRWLADHFGAPPDPEADATTRVTVAKVRSFQLPMLRQALEEGGIGHHVAEELSPGTWEQLYRIEVAGADVEAADRLLTEFGQR